MGETTKKSKGKIGLFFEGLKSEFAKIIWPTKEDVVKESIAVIVWTAVIAGIITLLDLAFSFGLDKLISL